MTDATATNADAYEVVIGPHTIRYELPDVIRVSLVGDVSLPMYRELLASNNRFAEDKPWTLVLIDMKRMGAISADARRFAVNEPTSNRAVALFNASLPIRMLTSLQAKALHLLYPDRDTPTLAFESEAEARAWLDARRRELVAKGGKRT